MTNLDPLFGYIIAGGHARRMDGRAKGLLQVSGVPVLARAKARLAPQVDRLVLNTNLPATEFTALGIDTLADDPGSGEGPLAGLLSCLAHGAAQSPTPPAILTVPGDCPFLPEDLIARLKEGLGNGNAAVATSGGRLHPLTGLWRVDLLPRLQMAIQEQGLRRARDWATDIGAAQVAFPAEPFDPFFNINTPDDLARAEALAVQFEL